MKLKNFIKLPESSKKRKPYKGPCSVCLEETTEIVDLLTNSFTDREKIKDLKVCPSCSKLFDDEYRKSAFYATKKETKKIQQKDFEDILFVSGPKFPCVLSFSESRKKHRMFRSQVSMCQESVHISTDSGCVVLNLKQDKTLFQKMSEFYNKYKMSKSWIKNGNYPVPVIQQIGYKEFCEYESCFKESRGSPKFELLLNFVNKNE